MALCVWGSPSLVEVLFHKRAGLVLAGPAKEKNSVTTWAIQLWGRLLWHADNSTLLLALAWRPPVRSLWGLVLVNLWKKFNYNWKVHEKWSGLKSHSQRGQTVFYLPLPTQAGPRVDTPLTLVDAEKAFRSFPLFLSLLEGQCILNNIFIFKFCRYNSGLTLCRCPLESWLRSALNPLS